MLWIWAVLPLVLAGSQLRVHTQGTNSISESLKLRRRVHETDKNCSEGLYQGGPFCCQPCQPGKKKVEDCKMNGGTPTCAPCTEGKEYMDKNHYADKCRRCTLCDEEHGLEVETNCTLTQNTKCKCKPDFYCDSPGCEHCVRCASCEHGTLEPCTATSNTNCRKQSPRNRLWLLTILVLLIPLVFIYRKYRKRKCWKRRQDDPESRTSSRETIPMNASNLSLSKYIPRIAEDMTIQEAKKFARENNIKEGKIDEIMHDSIQDTAEQKVQLLLCWYQSHGKSGAYQDLIKGLKKAECRRTLDKFQDMVQKDLGKSTPDTGNENEGQCLE